jgi:head-tail adaptor
MRVGKLDTQVRVERPVATSDPEFGGNVGATWETVATCWASISDITTRMQEQTKQDLRLLKRPCRVETRYLPQIDATMRLVVLDRSDRILQIVTKPAEIGRKEGLEFMAEDYTA